MDLRSHIRSIPNFPRPGIIFRDITPLLMSPDAMRSVIRQFADAFRDEKITTIIAAEARGFIFGAPLAMELNAAFVPVRKPGKLPAETHSLQYDLEYGTDTLEMHSDAIQAGDRVLVVDDLLATGGTVEACLRLLDKQGADVVGCAFVIELSFLDGRKRLEPHRTLSLISYDSEDG